MDINVVQNKYIELEDFEVYKLAREYSKFSWEIYALLDWQSKKIIGDQFIRSVDSVGANIAEGYGRFHYLDKNKFYYNARGSLLESKHWLELLLERKFIQQEKYTQIVSVNKNILIKLNTLIKTQYNRNKK